MIEPPSIVLNVFETRGQYAPCRRSHPAWWGAQGTLEAAQTNSEAVAPSMWIVLNLSVFWWFPGSD